MGTANDVLAVALRNVGFVEGPNDNENPYAALAGHANFQPWCASFVAACFKRAGMVMPNSSPYTPTMANGFKGQLRWFPTGKVGDVIFFAWPEMGRIAHVGIVELVLPGGVYQTVEGNTDAAGGRTGGRVMRQRRKVYIAGFGRPRYSSPVKVDRVLRLTVPVTTGPDVADVQNALNVWHRVKGYGLLRKDGVYGATTKSCVMRYQAAHRLTPDGVTGASTWVALRRTVHN